MRSESAAAGFVASALLACAYFDAAKLKFIDTQSKQVFALVSGGYLNLTECKSALAWAKNPDLKTLAQAARNLEESWKARGLSMKLQNPADYRNKIGEPCIACVVDVWRPLLSERDAAAEQYVVITGEGEEVLFGLTTVLRQIMEHHPQFSPRTDDPDQQLEHALSFLADVGSYSRSIKLDKSSRTARTEYYDLCSEYFTCIDISRSRRERAAAEAEGPAALKEYDDRQAHAMSHVTQSYNLTATRVLGKKNSRKREQFIDTLIAKFKDHRLRNIAPPFLLPNHLCPIKHETAFQEWVRARKPGQLLERVVFGSMRRARITPEELAADDEKVGAMGKAAAEARWKDVGLFGPAEEDLAAYRKLATVNLNAMPLHRDSGLEVFECPECGEGTLVYGTKNPKHYCPADGMVKSTGKLNHVQLATPYDLLRHHPDPDDLVARATEQDQSDPIIHRSINDFLPTSLRDPSLANTFCAWKTSERNHPRLQDYLKYQALVAYAIIHHDMQPINEYQVLFHNKKIPKVWKTMWSPEGDVIIETEECTDCYYRGIEAVPRHKSEPGVAYVGKDAPKHARRANGKAQPPLAYLPKSYVEDEFDEPRLQGESPMYPPCNAPPKHELH